MKRVSRWLAWIIVAIGLLVLWLAFAASTGWREFVGGVIGSTIAFIAMLVYRSGSGIRMTFTIRELAQAWRIPWQVVTGTVLVFKGLTMRLLGRDDPSVMVVVGYDAVGKTPAETGRRALAIIYPTLTPNAIVLGTVREQHRMLSHQLIPQKLSALARNLGANP